MPASSRGMSVSALALTVLGSSLVAHEAPAGRRKIPVPRLEDSQAEKGHDDSEARAAATLAWFGGRPSLEYLDFLRAAAREESLRWSHLLPGAKLQPAVPGSSSTWVNLGPRANLISGNYPDIDAGRPVSIVTHPTNPQVLYLATSGGGVWKSTNADPNSAGDWAWTSITDSLPNASSSGNVSIGALAMDPGDASGNTLFLGLGDGFDAEGRGLYKTTDGGATWTELPVLGASTRTLDIHCIGNGRVLVGTNVGLFVSSNSGASFTPNLQNGPIWSIRGFGTLDLVLTQTNSSGVGTAWYSSDGGLNWTGAALSAAITSQSPGRMTLATSPASTTTAYGELENASSRTIARGVMKTVDKGHTWTWVPAATEANGLFQSNGQQMGSDGGQSNYNQAIALSPTDPDTIFMGANLALYRSTNGGLNWSQMTHWYGDNRVYAHADFHCTAWSKAGPATLFVGNDGGLAVVRDPFRASIPVNPAASDVTFIDNRRNRGLSTHLVFNIGSTMAASPADSKYRITLGLQDNGTRVRQTDGGAMQDSFTYEDRTTGDGFGTVIHPTNGNLMLGSIYYMDIRKSTNGGTSQFTSANSGLIGSGSSSSSPFFTKLALGASATPDTVYTFNNTTPFRSTNFATSWTALGTAGLSGTIRNIGASASNGNALALALTGGRFAVTYNGGTSWTVSPDLTNGFLNTTNVAFDSSNDQVLYGCSAGFSAADSHLFKSQNGGGSWSAIDRTPGGQPNGFPFGIPVHVVKVDPSNSSVVLAGTNFGVYRSDDAGATWSRYGQGLPMVAVRDLYVAPDGSFVRAGTYGRGAWELAASAAPAPTLTSFNPASGFANTIVTLTGTNFTGVTGVKYNGTAATFNFLSDTSIQSFVPAGATTGPITVTTPGGTATSATSFTVLVSPPTIASFTPTSGPVGTPVTVTGTNLSNASSLTFNSAAATFTVVSPTSITTTVPAGATTGPIAVTTPGGVGVGPTFTVTIPPAPVISSFTASPPAILAGGSSTLSWTVSGATSLSISGLGAVTGTSTSVSPTTTTTYVLTASNSGGSATANATVTVKTRDLDGSGGSPDVLDMAVMARAYSGSGVATPLPAADLDGDGDVDEADLLLFLAGL